MQRRLAELPLHGGKAPAWLFSRMWRMAGAITMAVVDSYGPAEMLRRLADPWWFQAFGCVLGFDWHSSGVTTVTCGAMKEAYKRFGADLGVHVAGGKGGTSRKTPQEIAQAADRRGIAQGEQLIHASKMSAKVDSAGVQDGYDLYHHCFFFGDDGRWCVVQQGMNEQTNYARRYHWLGEAMESFVCEPHFGIQDMHGPSRRRGAVGQLTLNMVALEAEANRKSSVDLVGWNPDKLLDEIRRITDGPTLFAPAHHPVHRIDVNLPRLEKIVRSAHEANPQDFTALLGSAGVGPATVRSLSLLAELIYSAPASHRDPTERPPTLAHEKHFPLSPVLRGEGWGEGSCRTTDTAGIATPPHPCPLPRSTRGEAETTGGPPVPPPARPTSPSPLYSGERVGVRGPGAEKKWADYSYAHGGKDGHPFPVDRATYDKNIAVLAEAVRRARVGETEKVEALKRLAQHTIPT